MLDSVRLEYFRECVVAKFPTTIRDEFLHLSVRLILIKGFEFHDRRSGVGLPMKEGYADESRVLIHKGNKVSLAGVGGRSNRSNQISMNNSQWVFSGVEMTLEWHTRDFPFHTAVAGTRLGELDARKDRLKSGYTSMT